MFTLFSLVAGCAGSAVVAYIVGDHLAVGAIDSIVTR